MGGGGATKAGIWATSRVKRRTFNDMEEAARALREHDSRRESIFRQSVDAQKNASELLEKKFQEAVKKAKETPDTGRPIRDFDLDYDSLTPKPQSARRNSRACLCSR